MEMSELQRTRTTVYSIERHRERLDRSSNTFAHVAAQIVFLNEMIIIIITQIYSKWYWLVVVCRSSALWQRHILYYIRTHIWIGELCAVCYIARIRQGHLQNCVKVDCFTWYSTYRWIDVPACLLICIQQCTCIIEAFGSIFLFLFN